MSACTFFFREVLVVQTIKLLLTYDTYLEKEMAVRPKPYYLYTAPGYSVPSH
jgi:hypothetical protein